MDIKDIKILIKMITETDISEFEMENAEEKIRLKRGSQPEIIHYQAPPQVASSGPFIALPPPTLPLTWR